MPYQLATPVSVHPKGGAGEGETGTRAVTRRPHPAAANNVPMSAATATNGLPDTKTILHDDVFLCAALLIACATRLPSRRLLHFFLDFHLKQSYKGDTTALSNEWREI